MAIISCPSCRKQISDKSKHCSHCDTEIGEMTSEAIASKRRVTKLKKSQSIQVQTFLALILFVGGFSIWYWESQPSDSWISFAGQGMIAVGFVWYMVNRVRLILLKKRA